MSNYDFRKLQNGSDIRGVALDGIPGEPVTLTPAAVGRLAKGFLYWLTQQTGKTPSQMTVTVGCDSRLSGEALAAAFCDALSPFGVRVLNCGLASTPAMFMSTVFDEFRADGAVMVTASHLPWNRNGLKFFSAEGGLNKGDITDIIVFAESDQILGMLPPGAGNAQVPRTQTGADLMEVYAAHLRELICRGVAKAAGTKGDSAAAGSADAAAASGTASGSGNPRPLEGLKICVDAGNGAGGFYAGRVLAPLGADVSASQFLEPDGTFPNHAPNPENKDAMKSVCAAVTAHRCDLGIIFDTDVDRSSAVDEKGCEISRNGIVAMAAALIADEHPGTTVVTDSVTSDELHTYLEGSLGLKHLRFRRGYRNVINKAIELNNEGTDAQLAIETSGHAAYRDNYFLDDGAFLATRIVIRAAVLKRKGQGISSVIAALSEPAESEEVRLPITAEDFSACADGALEAVRRWASDPASAGDTGISLEIVQPNYEGIRVAYRGAYSGWFLLRKSLHDPIMPLNIESAEAGGCSLIRRLLSGCLADIDGLDTSGL